MKRCKVVAVIVALGHVRTARATQQSEQPEPWRRALLVSLPALAFLLGCFPGADFDVWWHLRTGQLILETRAVPRSISSRTPTPPGPGLTSTGCIRSGLALLYRAGGRVGAGAAQSGGGRGNRRAVDAGAPAGPSRLALGSAWLPGVLMVSGRLSERPEAASLVLLTAYLVLLARAPARRAALAVAASRCCGSTATGSSCSVRSLLLAYAAEWVVERLRLPRRVRSSVRRRGRSSPSPLPPPRLSGQSVRGSRRSVARSRSSTSSATPPSTAPRSASSRPRGTSSPPPGIWNPYLLAYFASGPGPGQLRPLRTPRRGAPVSGVDLRRGRLPRPGRPRATPPSSG